MLRGVVKYYNEEKGFGFILRDDGQPEIFVHISNCAENIQYFSKGDRVQFDECLSERNGKPEALNVILI